MRIKRFQSWLMEQLNERPGFQVDEWHEPEQTRPLVKTSDGREFYLVITGAAPPGGDDYAQPETIVERPPDTEIQVFDRP